MIYNFERNGKWYGPVGLCLPGHFFLVVGAWRNHNFGCRRAMLVMVHRRDLQDERLRSLGAEANLQDEV